MSIIAWMIDSLNVLNLEPMAKKTSLKATLSSHQNRLKKNTKAQEASQRNQRQNTAGLFKRKGPGMASISKASTPKARTVSRKRSTSPFRPTDTILLVGEGNFSYALALLSYPALQYLPAKNVTATAYDSEQGCFNKYPEAREIVDELRRRGVEVLFSVDATALEKCKPLKGRRWDRIVWNFPHAGKGITDQNRNILSNQMLLLGFLRSAAPFLVTGSVPSISVRRKKKKNADDVDDELDGEGVREEDEGAMSEVEDTLEESPGAANRDGTRGTVLVTLRNVPPYTEWNLPKLAKSPPPPQAPSAKPNPRYTQLRSFVFHREDWPGYEHRMTKGERAHGSGKTGQGGEDRTWEFCLRDPE